MNSPIDNQELYSNKIPVNSSYSFPSNHYNPFNFNIPPTILFLVLSSLSTALGPFLNRVFTECYELLYTIYELYIQPYVTVKYNKITLNYTTTSNHSGRLHSDISTIIISLLYWIKTNMNDFDDLYSLAHDSSMKEYNQWDEILRSLSIYRINQKDKIKIYTKNNQSIYLRCYELSEKGKEEKGENLRLRKTYMIELFSKEMSLQELDTFLEMCKKMHKESLENDKNQYIFTYIPNSNTSVKSSDDSFESSRFKRVFRKEKFNSFSDFNALYGKKFKQIESTFDFFESKSGATWYEDRNLPYQKTILNS